MRTRRVNYQKASHLTIPSRRKKTGKQIKKTETISDSNITKALDVLYNNVKSPPSFSQTLKTFLRQNKTSSLFKPVRKKFLRRPIIAHFPYQFVMSDTINYRKFARKNDNNRYIMILIDVFSKKAFAEPMKTLKDFDSKVALERIFRKLPEIPQYICTDEGGEYYNAKCQQLFENNGTKHYSIRGPHKAAIAERFIRTLKERLEKFFYSTKSYRWLDILQDFINNYNNTIHTKLSLAPNQVNEANRQEIFKRLYPSIKSNLKPRLAKGDRVRILKEKTFFEKGYTRNWSEEIYSIKEARTQAGVDYYIIQDTSGAVLPKKKYFWELNLVSKHVN